MIIAIWRLSRYWPSDSTARPYRHKSVRPTKLTCVELCQPPQDVGEINYENCLTKCTQLPICGSTKCSTLEPIGPCVTYACNSTGQWVLKSTRPGVSCQVGGLAGTCNAAGACVANAPKILTRQDVAKLSAAQVASFQKGFQVMIQRSFANPNDPPVFFPGEYTRDGDG